MRWMWFELIRILSLPVFPILTMPVFIPLLLLLLFVITFVIVAEVLLLFTQIMLLWLCFSLLFSMTCMLLLLLLFLIFCWLLFNFIFRAAAAWRLPLTPLLLVCRAWSSKRWGTVHRWSHCVIMTSVNLQHCAAIRTWAPISFLSAGWTNLKHDQNQLEFHRKQQTNIFLPRREHWWCNDCCHIVLRHFIVLLIVDDAFQKLQKGTQRISMLMWQQQT